MPSTTPTLDEIRDKIERRYANAIGRVDLASGSVEARMLEVRNAALGMAGNARLDEIRAGLAHHDPVAQRMEEIRSRVADDDGDNG